MTVEIPINSDWHSAAVEFANTSLASRKRKIASRGQLNTTKIKQDIVNGVLAEFAAHQRLTELGLSVSLPDLNVYPAHKKCWKADLTGGGYNFHVKSFTNLRWFSWVFTYNVGANDIDPLVVSPKPNDILVLTQVAPTTVIIHHIVAASAVKHLYRPPLLPHLKCSKTVLYPADLKQIPNAF